MAKLDFKGVSVIQFVPGPMLQAILWVQGIVPGNFENWNFENVISYNLRVEFLAAILVTLEHLVTSKPRSATVKTGGGALPPGSWYLIT